LTRSNALLEKEMICERSAVRILREQRQLTGDP
jgi:hypothetical protein